MYKSIEIQPTHKLFRFGWHQIQFFIICFIYSIKCDSNHSSGIVRYTLYMLLLLFLFFIRFQCMLRGRTWPIYLARKKENEKSICLVHVVLCLSKINNRFCASYKLCFARFIVVMTVYSSFERRHLSSLWCQYSHRSREGKSNREERQPFSTFIWSVISIAWRRFNRYVWLFRSIP